MSNIEKAIELLEAKKELTAADIDDNAYYEFKAFHITSAGERDLGKVKKKGKELKQQMQTKHLRITAIKKTSSPQEDEQRFMNKKKAQAKWAAAWDGPRK